MSLREKLSILRPMVLILGFGGALMALVLALGLDKGLGKETIIISPHDPSVVQLNQGLYMQGDPVAEIYGNPLNEPVRVINPPKDKLIHPRENPELLLLKVNKSLGENPLQAQTVWYFARFAIPALLILGIIGFVLPRRKPVREGLIRGS